MPFTPLPYGRRQWHNRISITMSSDPARAEFDAMPLEMLEEASGELHRRLGNALRRLGEARADEDDETGMTPRWRVTALASTLELAAHSLAAIGAGVPALPERSDQASLAIASLMYATPDLGGLLARLEQDRRQLGSLARSLEARLQETHHTAFQFGTLRQLLTEVAIAEPARCAQSLEAHLAALELGELAAAAGEDSELAEDSV